MKLRSFLPLGFLSLLAGLPTSLFARDHHISADVAAVDGVVLGVAPGDRILVQAGPRGSLRLKNLVGTAEAPITVINSGGQVVIHDPTAYAGIAADQCRHLHLTGTGDPDHVYGFHITGTNEHGSGVIAAGLSSDIEIDHIHIQDTGFAGMLIKTDGAVGTFMDNVNLHHNYLHDTGGEGFYIGETKYPAQIFRGLQVWNNVVARTGWEALQLANCHEDIRIHHNVFYQAGLEQVLWQDNNLQFAAAVNAEIDHNIVIGAVSNLVIVSGGLPKRFHHNYLEHDNGNGPMFYLDDSRFPEVADTALILEKNFFRLTRTRQSVVQFGGRHTRLELRDNTFTGTSRLIKTHRDADLTGVHDNVERDLGAPAFIDPANGDFRLRDDDPYRALGIGLLPTWQPPGPPQAIE